MVARNVVVRFTVHSKPVPIPVRFRAPPQSEITKLVRVQYRGLFFFSFFFFFLFFLFSLTVIVYLLVIKIFPIYDDII